jgi:penicillin-binding protein 2
MDLVVNGAGTAVRSRLPLDDIKMAGKTGTAQVRRISGTQRGQSGEWKYRDHGLFVCYAPTDRPRYAAAVVIDHGMGGARAAAPVAKDFLTYMFDPAKAMEQLSTLEAGWGGDINTRMAARQAHSLMSAPNPTSTAHSQPSSTVGPAAAPATPGPTVTAQGNGGDED